MRFALIAFLVMSATASAATKTVWRTDKPDALAKLNDDLKQAMQGATLNSKQRRELNKSQSSLQQAVDAHKDGKSFATQPVLKAYKQIETMNKADVFTAQDKKTISKDLGKLKDQVLQPRRPKRGYDPYGMPRARRR